LAVSGTGDSTLLRCLNHPLPAVLRRPKAKWCRSPKEKSLHLLSHKARPADDLIRASAVWAWRVKPSLSLSVTCSTSSGKTLEKSPSRCLPTTCATRCWPPRLAWVRGDGSDPVSVLGGKGGSAGRQQLIVHLPFSMSLQGLGRLPAHVSKLKEKHGVNLIAIMNGTARPNRQPAADSMKESMACSGWSV
jgi:hypothetical protein